MHPGGNIKHLAGGLFGLMSGLVFSCVLLFGIHEPNSLIGRKLELEPTMLRLAYGITVIIDESTMVEAGKEEHEDKK